MGLKNSETIPLRTLAKHVDASYYNRVRLGLLRLSNPLRVELTELRVELVCTDTSWTCLSQETRAPLLTWTDFISRRDGLHRPVPCTLHLYHIHAGLLAAIALEAADVIIKHRLSARRHYLAGGIVSGDFARA